MIYAETATGIERRRKAFLRKWRLKCRAVADSLDEAGERLFTFTRLEPTQWKSARTTNAIERLHAEFKRRIKTPTVLPHADTAPMPFRTLLASGRIVMRKVDEWETLNQPLADQPIDLAAQHRNHESAGERRSGISTTFKTAPISGDKKAAFVSMGEIRQ